MTRLPASLSLFRGQARDGIGEGPGQPVAQGEQYLDAAEELHDPVLLRSLRPWMTLDSDPSDRSVLGEQLEGWSCLEAGGYLVVVRLGAAGKYDRRAAYFSHGRAWKLDDLDPATDPGLLLGRSEAFDRTWGGGGGHGTRDGGLEAGDALPSLGRVVEREPEVAARLLAALLQARLDRVPVCLAVPVLELAAGSDLVGLVAFARAALPHELRRGCRLRLYTRVPQRYLGELEADLVAVPEVEAAAAMATRSDAVLLDRQGEGRPGRKTPAAVRAYAEQLVDRTLQEPELLPRFTARYHAFRRRPPVPPLLRDLSLAGLVHGLADLVRPSRQEDPRLGLELWRLAERLGPEGEGAADAWQRLLPPEDWVRVPVRDHVPLLFENPEDLSPRLRALQAAAEAAAVRLDRMGDGYLKVWWEATKLPRLAELLDRTPPLVSPAAVVRRSVELPLAALGESGHAAALLEAEREEGVLGQRGRDPGLVRLARDPGCRRVLLRATGDGDLQPGWMETWLESLEAGELRREAAALLAAEHELERWPRVAGVLLERLRGLGGGLAPLVAVLAGLGERLTAPRDVLPVAVPLADLLRRGVGPEAPFLGRLRSALGPLPEPSQRQLLELLALRGDRDGELAATLLVHRGEPVGDWLRRHPAALLALEPVRRRLRGDLLLDLAGRLPDDRGDLGRAVFAELTRRFRHDSGAVTALLVRTGWWFFWRQAAELEDGEARTACLEWLTSPAWWEGGAPEPALEAWERALVPFRSRPLGDLEMERLCFRDGVPAVRWPLIPDFEERQTEDLAKTAGTLGAVTSLVLALGRDRVLADWADPDLLLLLAPVPEVKTELVEDLLAVVGDREPCGLRGVDRLRPLVTVEGRLRRPARELLAWSLVRELDGDPEAALDLWEQAGLWSEDHAVETLRDWIRHGAAEGGAGGSYAALEPRIPQPPPPASPPCEDTVRLALRLEDRFPRLAVFLAPGAVTGASTSPTTERLLELLGSDRHDLLRDLLGRIALGTLRAGPSHAPAAPSVAGGPGPWLRNEEADLPTLPAILRELRALQPGPFPHQVSLRRFVTLLPDAFRRPVHGRLAGFQLASLLYADRTLGELARCFAYDGRRHGDGLEWWAALLREVEAPDRPWGAGAGDRPEVARALVHRLHRDLDDRERTDLLEAMAQSAPYAHRPSPSIPRRPR